MGRPNSPNNCYLAESREVLLVEHDGFFVLGAVFALTEVVAVAGTLAVDDVLG